MLGFMSITGFGLALGPVLGSFVGETFGYNVLFVFVSKTAIPPPAEEMLLP